MMMAQDSSDHPELSSASVQSLRVALQEYAERASETPTASLQQALRQIATEAREKEIHAEQLLVVLKDVWFALPEVGSPTDTELHNRLIQRVVTLCIREYYST